MSRYVNCTPHAIHILMDAGGIILPPSGQVARCQTASERVEMPASQHLHDDIPVYRTVFGNLEGLPDPEPHTYYVVSLIAAKQAMAEGRTDVVVTHDAVRDSEGRIIGCRGLAFPS